jgi:hypothetical protein
LVDGPDTDNQRGSLFERPGRVLNDERRFLAPGGYGQRPKPTLRGHPNGGPAVFMGSEQQHVDG